MKIIESASLRPQDLKSFDQHQTYNGLDCCLTLEIFEALWAEAQFEPAALKVYQFERDLQAPAMDMSLRGFALDIAERSNAINILQANRQRLEFILFRYAMAVWGKPLNPQSPAQLIDFFYRHMGLPEQVAIQKGVRRVSTNRESLEKLQVYFYARPIVNVILALRDISKKLSVLTTESDSDQRLRASYNIAGTETGRWSSSRNPFGTGTNLQNITAELRRVFVSDPGYKLCGIDLEQAESRVVGLLVAVLTGDRAYLDACLGPDLHTVVTKMVWPELPWTGNIAADKGAIAEQPFYRQYSYRDMSKRGGHGTNYYGKPRTMAMHLKVTTALMEEFQAKYFAAFPGIRQWHEWTSRQLMDSGIIETPMGRVRQFFGRPNDDATLRKAIAFSPQSTVGDVMNKGILQLWQSDLPIQLIAQVHDAVYFQYPESLEDSIIPQALSILQVPITYGNETIIIPGEAKTGWNWGNYSDGKKGPANPGGLKKWKPGDERKRPSGLDRTMARVF